MLPKRAGSCSGRPVPAGEVSVMPQPPRSSMPLLRFRLLAVSTGSGAPPEPQ